MPAEISLKALFLRFTFSQFLLEKHQKLYCTANFTIAGQHAPELPVRRDIGAAFFSRHSTKHK
jgi:hypothetical protein